MIRDGKKYIDLPIPELYDLRRDSAEASNLAAAPPQPLDAGAGRSAAFRAPDRGPRRAAESAETREKLASLGYVGAGAGAVSAHATEDDDPKRLIALDAMVQDVGALYAAGDLPRCARARAASSSACGRRCACLIFTSRTSSARAGTCPPPSRRWRRRARSAPKIPPRSRCSARTSRRRAAPARPPTLLEAPARAADPDVEILTTRGLALAKAGRFEEALASLARAREVSPKSAMVLVHEGTVRLMAGDPGAGARPSRRRCV